MVDYVKCRIRMEADLIYTFFLFNLKIRIFTDSYSNSYCGWCRVDSIN